MEIIVDPRVRDHPSGESNAQGSDRLFNNSGLLSVDKSTNTQTYRLGRPNRCWLASYSCRLTENVRLPRTEELKRWILFAS
jgi:hypothetical protein